MVPGLTLSGSRWVVDLQRLVQVRSQCGHPSGPSRRALGSRFPAASARKGNLTAGHPLRVVGASSCRQTGRHTCHPRPKRWGEAPGPDRHPERGAAPPQGGASDPLGIPAPTRGAAVGHWAPPRTAETWLCRQWHHTPLWKHRSVVFEDLGLWGCRVFTLFWPKPPSRWRQELEAASHVWKQHFPGKRRKRPEAQGVRLAPLSYPL